MDFNKNSADYKKALQVCREILEGEFGTVSEESVAQCAGTFFVGEILKEKLKKGMF